MAAGALIGMGEGEEQQAPAIRGEVVAPRQRLHRAHARIVDRHPFQGDQGQIRLRLGRIEGDRGIEGPQRLLRAAELAQDGTTPVLGVIALRITVENLLQDRQGLFMPAHLAQSFAEGELRRGEAGPPPQHIAIAVQGLLVAPGLAERIAEIVGGVDIVRIERQGALQALHRLRRPAELGEDIAEIAQRPGMPRVERDGLGDQQLGFLVLPLLRPHDPQKVEGVEIIRLLGEGLAVEPFGRLKITRAMRLLRSQQGGYVEGRHPVQRIAPGFPGGFASRGIGSTPCESATMAQSATRCKACRQRRESAARRHRMAGANRRRGL